MNARWPPPSTAETIDITADDAENIETMPNEPTAAAPREKSDNCRAQAKPAPCHRTTRPASPLEHRSTSRGTTVRATLTPWREYFM